MHRKRINTMFAILLASSMALCACGQSSTSSEDATDEEVVEEETESTENSESDSTDEDDIPEERFYYLTKLSEMAEDDTVLYQPEDTEDGITVTLPDLSAFDTSGFGEYSLSEEDLEEYVQGNIDYMIENMSETNYLEDATVEEDSNIGITFVAYDENGELVEDLTVTVETYLSVADGLFGTTEFTEALIGMAPDEERTITVTMPEGEVPEEYEGKDITFEVTLWHIAEYTQMTWDDETVAQFGFETTEEAEEYIRALVVSNEKTEIISDNLNQIKDWLLENAVIEGLDDAEIESLYQTDIENLKAEAEELGMTYEEYVETYYTGSTSDDPVSEFENELRELYEVEYKWIYILEQYGRENELVMTQSDYDAEVEYMAYSYGYDYDEFAEQLETYNDIDDLVYNFYMDGLWYHIGEQLGAMDIWYEEY